ncbi:glycosyltransferase [Cyanobium sp. Morenito 9A2]|uniref:glycosyltransferase n=1 Tax=Cyanobium sp. Morenito 9A2 TaxID=2823718 RepID=UPI0020CF804D|nr:glycosyltransferase [Cyanobium sp. Morenito 9A2]MCP9849446.1 glycosyltransferase [Cyanobium sp. Morenito 9A2]
MSRPRLALLCNFRAEASPSMQVCGDQLFEALRHGHPEFCTERLQPVYRAVLSSPPQGRRLRKLTTGADKMLNRYIVYPRFLRQRAGRFDLFHICDHSYASLVHHLPADRVGVLCHDVDVFRSVFQPKLYPRSPRYNAMQRHALAGLAKVAIVFHTTGQVKEDLLRFDLVAEDRLVQVPLGVHPSFLLEAGGQTGAEAFSRQPQNVVRQAVGDRPFLLNVSGTLPRKRLEVLLRSFALLRRERPDLMLVRVGPDWTAAQKHLIASLNLEDELRRIPRLEQAELVAFYKAARAVLMTSDSEGFGMPLIEALASGAVAVVSDIPVFHEVADDAAIYCPVGEPEAWARTLAALLSDPSLAPPLQRRLQQVEGFTWSAHAAGIAEAYQRRILERLMPATSGASLR